MSLTTPFNQAHHRFATVVAFCTFLLIVAGALVTSNDAGLAVPDWPTSFHHWPVTYGYFTVPLVGGIRWEHGHRILAQFIGLLTIVLAVWTSKVDRRPWMRKLGWAALATVIAQGVLGGITVLHFLPPSVSAAHATLGQTFFCIVVSLWLFTGRTWVQDPRMQLPTKRPSLPWLATASTACVYVQLILGAAFRHHGIKLLPHIISAAVVTFVLLCVNLVAKYQGLSSRGVLHLAFQRTYEGRLFLAEMLVGLVVGVVISLFQALTQIQEMTLVFVPKILAGSPVWMSIPAKVSFLSNVASSAAIVWCVSASACSRRNSPVTAPTACFARPMV